MASPISPESTLNATVRVCQAGQTADPDIVAPNASPLAESLRAFGYDLARALADLVDNSLSAGAAEVSLIFYWNGAASAIAVADDGEGMDEATLVEAMRLGSKNPRDLRQAEDLGRFGLGLKTAPFSQGRRVTVFSRMDANALWAVRCWDLDHIAETGLWHILREPSMQAEQIVSELNARSHGTIVILENLDRIAAGMQVGNDKDMDEFLKLGESVAKYFAMVYHRLMSGPSGVKISLNSRRIQPWDPFLADEPATQRLPVEVLSFKGARIEVEPFVLPHLSKLDPDRHKDAAGIKGWNAHQGFYVYRNRRLLVPGGWLDIKGWRQEEHYKLARIRIDIPNALDDAWEIDVTKSSARPPQSLRRELARIGERARSIAKRVYSYRGAKLIPAEGQERVFLWEQVSNHNRISYRLNRKHPIIERVRGSCNDSPALTALLRLIEETVPVPLITIADREHPDQAAAPFERAGTKDIVFVMRQVYEALRAGGYSINEAHARLQTVVPFAQFPAELQLLMEEEGN